MPRGRPPKPAEEKRRLGNPGKRPLPVALTAVPPMDLVGWELPPALALEKVLEAGVPWLASTDHPKVAMLREALELHQVAKTAGSIRDQLEAMKEVRALMSELGFDPAARSKLGLAEVTAQSKLEAMRARAQVSNQNHARRETTG